MTSTNTNFLNNMKVAELKSILSDHGLKISGTKKELIQRIVSNVQDIERYAPTYGLSIRETSKTISPSSSVSHRPSSPHRSTSPHRSIFPVKPSTSSIKLTTPPIKLQTLPIKLQTSPIKPSMPTKKYGTETLSKDTIDKMYQLKTQSKHYKDDIQRLIDNKYDRLSLYLGGARATTNEINILISALMLNTSVDKIFIDGLPINIKICKMIKDVLLKDRITTLSISVNAYDDDNAIKYLKIIISGIKDTVSLTYLTLNILHDDELLSLLNNISTLTVLNISNILLTSSSINKLIHILLNNNIETLTLSMRTSTEEDNHISQELYSVLANHRTIKDLSLSHKKSI